MDSVKIQPINTKKISFTDIFDIEEIQRLQDLFSEVNEVASIITYPDGIPITKSSNFCRLCSEIIRKTEKGTLNCFKSDAEIGRYNPLKPNVKKCLSGGLWDAGVSINVGDEHIANWLIGQVKNDDVDEEKVLKYADEIGVNKKEFLKAFDEVPVMSAKKFSKVADMLFAFVKEISDKAHKNIQLKNEKEKREKADFQNIEKEKKLDSVNNEIKIISENLPNVIWKADVAPDGKFENTYISEIADEMLDLSKGTINNSFEKYFSYVVPEHLENIRKTIAESIVDLEKSISISYQIKKANKELIWVESTGKAYFHDNKIQIFGITIDVTNQKETQHKLKESEDLLSQSQKVANIGSYVLDIRTESWVSTSILDEIFGIDKSFEKNTSDWMKIVFSEDRKMMEEHFINDVLGKHMSFNKEYRIKRPNDGRILWVHGMGKLEFDESGNPIKMIGTIQDINDRKIVNELLIKSEERYRSLLDNLPVGVFRSSLEGDVLSANPAMAEIYGFDSVDELLKVPASKYYAEINPRETMLEQLRKKDYLLNYETQEYKKDGSLIWVSSNYKLVKSENGKDLYIDGIALDITERKNTEIDLIKAKARAEESIERLRLVMQVTLDGPYDWNLVTNEIYFSDRWKEILGYEPDELPNDFSVWEKLTKAEDVRKSWKRLNQHIAGELDKFEMEFKMRHKNGHWIDILSRAKAQFDEQGKAIRIVGTHIDITESKRSEKLLKENEERFRKLTEHLPSGIAIYRPVNDGNDFQFIDINKTGEKITNSTREILIGNTLLEKFPKMKDSPLYDALKKVNKSGEDEFIPSFYYKDSLREGWRENYVYKLQTGEIVAIFRDTTELKKAEQNLRKQNTELKNAKIKAENNETRFKALHDASFGGIAIHDIGKILDCNYGLSKLSGYTHDELIGMDGLLLIEEKWRKTVLDNILAEYEKPYEVLGLKKNGEKYPVRLEGRMIPYKGKRVRVVEFRDITEIKRTEHELIIAKEKAEESDRLKSAFLANMSHEIRTPMNGILGFTSLLQEPGLTGEQQQSYIDIIQKSGDRMLNTVNDIIEISKIETGQVSMLMNEVNINEQLEFLCSFFNPEAKTKGIQLYLKNKLPENKGLVITDESKLTSILTNLIKNAVKYTEEGTITVSCIIDNNHLLFSVSDTGIGIPEKRQQAIFERFVQADIDDAKVHEGSGLGLTITKSYVEMLGGEIWVESQEMKGSTFYFTIDFNPVNDQKKSKKISITETKTEKMNEVLLLVAEDDEVSFMLMESILSMKNYKTIRAENGIEAIKFVKENSNIDLVLMDLKMPEMDGFEATNKIREFNSTIPIIAQTAYALEGDKEDAIKAGCNDYISKPIDKKELFGKIDNLING